MAWPPISLGSAPAGDSFQTQNVEGEDVFFLKFLFEAGHERRSDGV